MSVPALVFGGAALLLLLAVTAVVLMAVRRRREGSATIERRGWRRLPDGPDVVVGWDGWPFVVARKQGTARDVVVGEVAGVEFLSLRWSQSERDGGGSEIKVYRIVALRCELSLPHLTAVRGAHRVRSGETGASTGEVETGDRRFDKRWQVLGDPDLVRQLLVPEVREVMDDLDRGAWVMQPGWATRVVMDSFWSGEDAMLEELDRTAAPWRAVPAETWKALGGVPRFVTAVGDGLGGSGGPGGPGFGGSPSSGPGRGWD